MLTDSIVGEMFGKQVARSCTGWMTPNLGEGHQFELLLFRPALE